MEDLRDLAAGMIKGTLCSRGHFLDFFSVVDGFRDVCLVQLLGFYYPRINEQDDIDIDIPPLEKQLETLRWFFREYAQDYRLMQAAEGFYFVAHQKMEEKVRRFLWNYKRINQDLEESIVSDNSTRELGHLLSYPACCVEFPHEKDSTKRFRELLDPIPFTQCLPDCGSDEPWRKAYAEIVERYDLEVLSDARGMFDQRWNLKDGVKAYRHLASRVFPQPIHCQ